MTAQQVTRQSGNLVGRRYEQTNPNPVETPSESRQVEKLRDANLKFAATLKRVRADSLVIAGEARRLTRERDAALAEVERLKAIILESRNMTPDTPP